MEKQLRSFAKELIEAVSIGSAAKVKIIFGNYVKVLENINLKKIPNLKVHESSNSKTCNFNGLEKSNDYTRNLRVLVNSKDKQGRTPLQIAARLGFDEICKLLIDNGADIDTQRENCPSPLLLAASNNHSDVVRLLLEHDVIVSRPESVYAAANEAAFKGHTEVKDIIRSHMINKALDGFIKAGESDLFTNLKNLLYEMLMNENRHPIRLTLYLKENRIILKNIENCIGILYDLCEQQIKQANDEKLSFEFYEILFAFASVKKILSDPKAYVDDNSESNEDVLGYYIKSLLKNQPINGLSQSMLDYFQALIFSYPFKDSSVYKTKEIQPYPNFCNFETCETCRNRHGLKCCSSCRNIKYCSQTCQKLHWFVHKTECKKSCLNVQEMAKALETKLTNN